MSRLGRYDFVRIAGAMGAVAILTTACAATIDKTTTGSIPPQVEMLALPGNGGMVPMPPAWMRKQIEQRMNQGRVPGYVEVSTGKLRRACIADEDLLGCMVNLKGLKVTYIRSGLSKDVKHMVLLHEYAHDLYDWKHD
ncbi:MAG: hypothetical protein EON57_09180 [Alphaproteobacteria bacterium]|nr:MAG: hypothetical protein EON57_09180 [Alphaproteobacteria bacterium]